MNEPFQHLKHKQTAPRSTLDTFPAPGGVTLVSFTSAEVTCLCPVTGQPDFYTVTIEYLPTTHCIESKSLKLYLWSYRTQAMFGEALAAQIAGDIQDATHAESTAVTVKQNIRGGISMTVRAEWSHA